MSSTIGTARKRVLEVQARRAELKLQRERGELFDAKVAVEAWAAMVAAFRARALAIPRTTAEAVTAAAARGPGAVEAVLMEAIREALSELAAWTPNATHHPPKEPAP